MDESTPLVRAPRVLKTDVDELAVLLSDDLRYIGLAGPGGRIWDHLSSPITVHELVDRLCSEFQVTPEDCWGDVRPFLEELTARGLVREA